MFSLRKNAEFSKSFETCFYTSKIYKSIFQILNRKNETNNERRLGEIQFYKSQTMKNILYYKNIFM